MKKLSILIPAYNVERWLPRCLNSILSQVEDDIEIVIVDDGSTSGLSIRMIILPKALFGTFFRS